MNHLRNERVLSIVWNKGHMELNVGEFFGKSNQNEVKKMFRLIMRKFCTDQQRFELIRMINVELKDRKLALEEISKAKYKIGIELLKFNISNSFHTDSTAEKDLKKQCDRLKKALVLLERERW